MDTGIVRIVIDWGFSRFKLYAYDSANCLILEESHSIVDIVADPTFYDSISLEIIRGIVINFIWQFSASSAIHIFLSSQMHALAGILENGFKFISTWNDLSVDVAEESFVDVFEGVPLLHSMPIYKVKSSEGKSYASTHFLSQAFPSAPHQLVSLGSPLAMILEDLFGLSIPCSMAWWQSTCLSPELLGSRSSGFSFLSDTPVKLSKCLSKNLFHDTCDIFVYPELGDLQATASRSVNSNPITINLGTGSQVIFRDVQICKDWPFYRFWPHYENPLLTISHIPCGRLLSAYCEINDLPINCLLDTLEQIQSIDIVSVAKSNLVSLLYFPGYCSVEFNYIQNPIVTLHQISKLDSSVLLCLWIYQYISLIKKVLPSIGSYKEKVSVGVTGDLGGMAHCFCQILNLSFGPNVVFRTIDCSFDFS